MASLSSSAQAASIEIYGNANGLWSPTHPHVTGGRDKPNSPVLYTAPPPPEQVVEQTLEPIEEVPLPAVCPTLMSAPHRCPPSG